MSEIRSARDRLDRIISIAGRGTRFWIAAVIVIVVGGAISGGVAFTRPRVYKSEVLILYREGIRSSDLGGPDGVADPARKLGLKLKEMVLSRTRLQQIIDEFKLYPSIVADRGYVDAVDEMRNHIAFRVKDGDTFGLSFEGEDATRVQEVTASLADALIAENSKTRAEQAEVTKEFLDVEKKRTEGELRERETALAKFLAKHPEFAKESAQASGGGAGSAIRATAEKKSGKTPVDPTLLALEREATRIQERLGMPTAKKRKGDPSLDPQLIGERQAAEADLKAAQKDLESKLTQFTDQHPDVKQARQHVKTAEARLKHALDALTEGTLAAQKKEADAEADEGTIDRGALESQLKHVNDEIAAYKSKQRKKDGDGGAQSGGASWIVALETDWTRLNREVTEVRERYQQLQDKQFKASMAETAATSGRNAQMVIVDPAYKPTHPAKPRSTIAAVGALISIGLGLAFALGCALLDDRLYDRVDVERMQLPLLGVVPRASKRGANG